MNGETKQRVTAIIQGEKSTVSERLDLLLGMVLDVHETVHGHEARIAGLEMYPQTAKRLGRLILGLGALAGAVAGMIALFN